MRRFLLAPAWAAATLFVMLGCADRTHLELRFTSDLTAPTDINELEVVVESSDGTLAVSALTLTRDFPHTFVVRPGPTRLDAILSITVTARLNQTFVLRRVVSGNFIRGGVSALSVALPMSCRAVLCESGIDCSEGLCTGSTDGGTDVSIDTSDAGDDSSDGAPSDAEGDAPSDAPLDTTEDVPNDAPTLPRFSGLVINEIDYDEPGIDDSEFVEVLNTTDQPMNLDGAFLILVNGSDSVAYTPSPIALSGTLEAGQYFVVASPLPFEVDPTARVTRMASVGLIQNGPDGVLLWDTAQMRVIDSVAYGTSSVTCEVRFNGFGSGANICLFETTPLPAGVVDTGSLESRSLIRLPNGTDTNMSADDWRLSQAPTPGAANRMN